MREVVLPLTGLTVVTAANGTGKSSVYRALRLIADCGRGEVVGSLAREGGLQSVLWAAPNTPAVRGAPIEVRGLRERAPSPSNSVSHPRTSAI